MPVKKWTIQYLLALPAVFIALSGVQYLKGREAQYAIEFGLLWAFITATIFTATRIYYYRKNVYCKVCNDLPASDNSDGDKA